MLLFLLRNNRFHVHTLVVIFLVIKMVPDNANGLKCYTCDNCPIPADTDSKDCDGSCFSSGAKRGCILTGKVSCFITAVGGECYQPATDADKSIFGKMKECIGEDLADGGPTCICSTDNCKGLGITSGDGSNFAERSEFEGGRCYECQGTDDVGCKRSNWVEKFCSGSGGYCVVTKSGTRVGRGCVTSALAAECHKEVTGKLDCFDYGKDDNKFREFQQCSLRRTGGAGFQSGEPATELCYCKGDLCNDNTNKAEGISPKYLITIVSTLCIFLF